MCRSAQLRFDWTDVNFPLFVGTLHIALYNKSKNALFLQYNLDLAKNLPFIHKINYSNFEITKPPKNPNTIA